MNATDYRSPAEIQSALGQSMRALRVRAGLDQETAAARAGISVRALRDLEQGAGSSLDTFVRTAKALGISERLDLITPPQPKVSPMAIVQSAGKQMQRVRATSAARIMRADAAAGAVRPFSPPADTALPVQRKKPKAPSL